MDDARQINDLIRDMGIEATTASDTEDGGIEIDWNGESETYADYAAAKRGVERVASEF